MARVRLGRFEVEAQQLPPVCIVCGAPATEHRTKNFSWFPPWVVVLLLLGLPVFIIVALILTRRMRVTAPLCAEHRQHWSSRQFAMLVSTFVFLPVAFMVMVNFSPMGRDDDLGGLICLGLTVLGLTWVGILVAAQHTGVRPAEITDRSITLIGVSQVFADAVLHDDRPGESVPNPEGRPPSDQYYDPNAR